MKFLLILFLSSLTAWAANRTNLVVGGKLVAGQALTVVASASGAVYARVQYVTAQAGTATLTGVVAGNTTVVLLEQLIDAIASGVSSSLGNTYIRITNAAVTSGGTLYSGAIYVCTNLPNAGNEVLTVNGSAFFQRVVAVEYSTPKIVDVSALATANTSPVFGIDTSFTTTATGIVVNMSLGQGAPATAPQLDGAAAFSMFGGDDYGQRMDMVDWINSGAGFAAGAHNVETIYNGFASNWALLLTVTLH
jgi:hypothetical protein